MISFQGIGSGVKVAEIVDALVKAEKAPFESSLNRRQASITTDISAVGTLKGALNSVNEAIADLASADKFSQKSIKGNDSFVALKSTKSAEVGNYSVKVDELASAHKLVSAGVGKDDAVGDGKLTLSSGSNSFDIDVSGSDKLTDIRDAINKSDDNNSVTATIITDDNGQHLVLTSKETGVANAIKVVVDDTSDGNNTDNSGLSRLAYDPDSASPTFAKNLNEVNVAKDAKITIDGTLVVTNSTNEFVDAIDGVTITAKKIHDVNDDLSKATISENNSAVELGLEKFIKSYNELIESTSKLGKSGKDSAGPLAGDAMLRGVLNKIRQEISTPFSSKGNERLTLTEIGVHTDRYGKLSLDKDDLEKQLKKDPDALQNFFVGTDNKPGFAASFKKLTDAYTANDGIIEERIKSKKNQLTKIDDERIAFGKRLKSLEDRLNRQFNAMDSLVAKLKSTSSYLEQQLKNMPGVVKKK